MVEEEARSNSCLIFNRVTTKLELELDLEPPFVVPVVLGVVVLPISIISIFGSV